MKEMGLDTLILESLAMTTPHKNYLPRLLFVFFLTSVFLGLDCGAQHHHDVKDGQEGHPAVVAAVRRGLLDRHGREDEYYLKLIESDHDGSIAGYLLGLINRYNAELKRDPEQMTMVNARAAIVAGRLFGEQEAFREPLVIFVAETEGYRRRNNAAYGNRLLDVDGAVADIVRSLGMKPGRGALDTLLAIGKKGGLTPGGRLILYGVLSQRNEGRPEEREVIRGAMEQFLKAETDPEVIRKSTRYNYFRVVMDEAVPAVSAVADAPSNGPGKPSPAKSRNDDQVLSAPRAPQQGNAPGSGDNGKKSDLLMWSGILLGLAALVVAIAHKFRKSRK